MNTKHTHGKWVSRCGYVVAQSSAGEETLICRVRRDVKEAAANCDLLAAAPELLDAMQECCYYLMSTKNYTIARKMQAIVNKVTGAA